MKHKKHAKITFGFILKNISLIMLDVFIMFLTLASIGFFYAYQKTELPEDLHSRNLYQTSYIYDRSGEHILYKIYNEENRKIISHKEIPEFVRIATIVAEDNNFYSHHGIDLISIIRSAKTNIESKSVQQGGSTITQQLARNAFLDRKKTWRRKILEIIMAIKIEKHYSKEDILDMYLNEVPYGSNAYGIAIASETFFSKKAKDLTLDEVALLAALPNAPTYYSPYGNHIDELVSKQQKVLDRIEKLKLIDSEKIQEAKKTITFSKIVPFHETIDCPHFVFYVKEKLEETYGSDLVEKGGLKIYTTLDYDLQKTGEKIVSEGVRNNQKFNAENAALVSLDPKNGQILTMIGSRNFFDEKIDGQVNVAIRARQPGSSFKPFAYAKAFEKGYEPETLIIDSPTDFGPDGSGKNYIPRNYDEKFHGLVTMRQALAMSLNVPAVKTLYLAGVNDTIELAHRLGITTLNKKNYYGLSLVLGGGEVSLLDETAGFSVFANDGKKNPVTAILKIENVDGKTIFQSESKNEVVLDPQIARKINSILSDNQSRAPIFGINNSLHISGKNVAAKTGTSQKFRDAWTIGYTPSIAVGVWAGNNDNRPMHSGANGISIAAPIWRNFMFQVLERYENEKFADYDRQKENLLLSERKKSFRMSHPKKEEKNKKSSKKEETRIEFLKNYSSLLSVEFQNSSDPMIQRWKNSLNNFYSTKN